MTGLSAERPWEIVLAARVAREFYIEGVSKVEIADRLGISRFRVARLLDSAREAGMVRIEIGLPGGALDAGLSAELCSAFGLKYAFAFDFPDEDELALRRRLSEAAGQALTDIITPGDVIGLSWARSLSGLAASLTRMPPCPIVQLTGAVPPPDGRDLLDLVRSVARIGGGTAHVFYAPMIVDDAGTAAAIRRQADVADALALVPSVTIAMVAIGAWAPALSTIYDACSPAERADIARLGVIAETAGVFLGPDGRPVPTRLDSRMIVTPGEVLAKIPSVIAVAYGVAQGRRGPRGDPRRDDSRPGHARQHGPCPAHRGLAAVRVSERGPAGAGRRPGCAARHAGPPRRGADPAGLPARPRRANRMPDRMAISSARPMSPRIEPLRWAVGQQCADCLAQPRGGPGQRRRSRQYPRWPGRQPGPAWGRPRRPAGR